MDIDWGAVRVRATSYVTRVIEGRPELLTFDFPSRPDQPTALPGGGVEAGERPDRAAVREVLEETGIGPDLAVLCVVGVQQGRYDTGMPCINIFFHLNATESRSQWTHRMICDPESWDTGLDVSVRFEPLDQAARRLRRAGYREDEFVGCLILD